MKALIKTNLTCTGASNTFSLRAALKHFYNIVKVFFIENVIQSKLPQVALRREM